MEPGTRRCLRGPGSQTNSEERSAIERLLALVRSSEAGSKIRWLLRALARIKEPAIVFTEYRDTVEAVLAALPAGHSRRIDQRRFASGSAARTSLSRSIAAISTC